MISSETYAVEFPKLVSDFLDLEKVNPVGGVLLDTSTGLAVFREHKTKTLLLMVDISDLVFGPIEDLATTFKECNKRFQDASIQERTSNIQQYSQYVCQYSVLKNIPYAAVATTDITTDVSEIDYVYISKLLSMLLSSVTTTPKPTRYS